MIILVTNNFLFFNLIFKLFTTNNFLLLKLVINKEFSYSICL